MTEDFELVDVVSEEGPMRLRCYMRRGVWAVVEDKDQQASLVVHVPTGLVAHALDGVYCEYTSDEAIWLCRVLEQWPEHGADLAHGDELPLTQEQRVVLEAWELELGQRRAATLH